MHCTTTHKTIGILRQIFAQWGLPRQLVSDNGPQFTAEEFKQFCSRNGIQHVRTAPYHPSSNGAAERLVQTFKCSMYAMYSTEKDLDKCLANFLISYRNTPQSTTTESPAQLMFGRRLRSSLDLLRPDIYSSVLRKQAVQKENHDKHSKEKYLEKGQKVWVRAYTKSQERWLKGTIRENRSVMCEVQVEDGRILQRHVDQLRHRLETDDTVSQDEREPLVELSEPTDVPPPLVTPRYPQRDRRPPLRYSQAS